MDIYEELKILLDELAVGGNKISSGQTDRLFNIHNTIFPNIKEHGRTCTTCKSRVYNRLKNYYAAVTPNSN